MRVGGSKSIIRINGIRGITTPQVRFCGSQVPASVPESLVGSEYSPFKSSDVPKLKQLIDSTEKLVEFGLVRDLLDRADKVAVDSAGAVYLLHCLANVSGGSRHAILANVIQRVEEEYFSANGGWLNPRSPFARMLVDLGIVDPASSPSFKSVVHQLPPKCKALIVGANITQASKPKSALKTREEIEARWHSMDPVDMETAERDHYLKTKQVLRTRHVEAIPSPMRPGSRLAQVLGMEFLQSLTHVSVEDFVCFTSALILAPKNGVFHRDLKQDAQFAMSKRILQFSDEDVGRYIIPLCLALTEFEATLEIPNRVWARKIVPVIRQGLAQVEHVPEHLRELNEVSRWALLSATVMGSGRVPVTNRLVSYLVPKIAGDVSGLDSAIGGKLLDAFVSAGVMHKPLLSSMSERAESLAIDSVVKLVHARNHFGLFGVDFDHLVDLLRSKLESDPSQVDSWSRSSKLMLLNSLFASSAETQSEAILKLTSAVCARLPDLDIDSLGRIDSVLE